MTANEIGFYLACGITMFFILITPIMLKKPKQKNSKGGGPKAFQAHVDGEGNVWKRTLSAPPPWSKKD